MRILRGGWDGWRKGLETARREPAVLEAPGAAAPPAAGRAPCRQKQVL